MTKLQKSLSGFIYKDIKFDRIGETKKFTLK